MASVAGASSGDTKAFGVGDEILIQGRHVGTVKFIGTTSFDPAGREWIGVELERPIGKHDGKVKSVRYFTAKAKHGTFVARKQCELFTEEKRAARKIQAAARMKIAKKKVEQDISWRTYNALDASDESDHLHRRQQLMTGGLPQSEDKLSAAMRERVVKEADSLEPGPEYKGLRLKFPMTMEQCHELIAYFKGGNVLHYKYVVQVLEHFAEAMAKQDTLVETTVAKGERLAVVGDTHGQLQDMYSIFTINGTPDERNRYLVNGDFVDRGRHGAEIALTLFCFHLANPHSLLMNRGNHEETSQNETQGFLQELASKYGPGAHTASVGGSADNSRFVYGMFHHAFDTLPLATLIRKGDRKVFVVHGGLFDRNQNVKLSHIQAIKRRRSIPWGRTTFEDKLFEDMMWSDPREDMRGTEPSTRGAGVFFGPDVTERFCALNGISLVIRSHECVKEGYMYQHQDRCLTIFSASRYCGTGVNSGAFIVFDSDLTNVVQQFMAGPLESTKPAPLAASALSQPYKPQAPPRADEVDSTRQKDVVKSKIIERIVLKKPDLYWYFSNADKEHTGTIDRLGWAEAMRTVLDMPDLQWMRLSYELVDADADGKINYSKFLERYRIRMREEDQSWQNAVLGRVCEKLFKMCSSLDEAYKLFDSDGSGKIEYSEFVGTLEKLDVGLSRKQIYELMRSIDTDQDSKISLEEFAQRFRIVFSAVQKSGGKAPPGGAPLDEWTLHTLQRVGTHLFAGSLNASQLFAKLDTDKDSAVSRDEFHAALGELRLDPPLTADEEGKLMRAIDTNNSGHINYVEFIEAFSFADVGAAKAAKAASDATPAAADAGGDWQRAVIEQVVNVLFEYRIELGAAFEKFDLDNSGTVSSEEFRMGLKALTGAIGSNLTDMQADELLKSLDKNGDGVISYQEFLEGFSVIDTEASTGGGAAGGGGGGRVPASGAGR